MGNSYMKKRILIYIFIIISIGLSSLIVVRAINKKYTSISNDNIKINASEIDLYFLDESAKKLGVKLPDDLPTSFKLEISGTNLLPEYKKDSSYFYAYNINEDGVITPTNESEANTYVDVVVNNKTFRVKINIIDYLDIYADNVLEEYINKNITDDMNDYQKMEKIASFVAQYEYNTSPDYRYLTLLGGGDCIASSHTIIRMSEMVGIEAYERYAATEPGAGANHRNVSAILDGKVYTIEAGYNEPAPRSYTIEEEPDGFRFGWVGSGTDNAALLQYDGFAENVVVPSTFSREFIDGPKTFNIKTIVSKAFTYSVSIGERKITSISLPDTLTTIESEAFMDLKDLKTINIPLNVKEIGKDAFKGCTNLVNINVDERNSYFTFEDGILYNKDKTEIIWVSPSVNGEVKLDDNVQIIKTDAFSDAKNIISLTLGSNVQIIETNAFENLKAQSINLPASLKTIEEGAFNNCYAQVVTFEEGSQVQLVRAAFITCSDLTDVIIPSSITSIDEDTFLYSKNITYHVLENSKALEWAEQYNKKYEINNPNELKIFPGMVKILQSTYTYDGEAKKPDVQVIYNGKVLEKDLDYILTYENNTNASKNAKVIIKGSGKYTGEVEKYFTISTLPSDFTIEIPEKIPYGEKINLELIPNNAGYKVPQITYNTTKSLTGGTKEPPVDVGTYYVYVSVIPENYNYTTKGVWAKFSIVKAPNELAIECADVKYGNDLKIKVLTNKSGGKITYYYKKVSEPDTSYTTDVPRQVGNYNVKAVAEETDNYEEGVAIATFSIFDYLKGDLNYSNAIELEDVMEALKIITEQKIPTKEDIKVGDFDGNGEVDTQDAFQILYIYVNSK